MLLAISVYVYVYQRDAAKKIFNFIVKMVKWPFQKASQGITWVVNKIKSMVGKGGTKKKRKAESINSEDPEYMELYSLAESYLMLEADDKKDKASEADKKSILEKTWNFIKKYGYSVPKDFVFKMWVKYASLFDKATREGVAPLKKELSEAKKKLKEVISKGDDKDSKAAKDAQAKVDELSKKILDVQSKQATNWKAIVVAVIVVLIIAAVIYYVYKKKKSSAPQKTESFDWSML